MIGTDTRAAIGWAGLAGAMGAALGIGAVSSLRLALMALLVVVVVLWLMFDRSCLLAVRRIVDSHAMVAAPMAAFVS